jgi:hypothetical protein
MSKELKCKCNNCFQLTPMMLTYTICRDCWQQLKDSEPVKFPLSDDISTKGGKTDANNNNCEEVSD